MPDEWYVGIDGSPSGPFSLQQLKEKAAARKATLDSLTQLVLETTPTRRLGNDEDLKGLVVLLASEASRHITGQAIAVDGGASIL